jgi:cell division protein FtsL
MAADPAVAPPRPRAPHRPRLRPAPPPRRVSGRNAATAAPQRAPRTGPRTQPKRAPRGRTAVRAGTVALPAPIQPLHRALEALRALPDSRLLDRLIRGQGWIVIIGIALMGIVAMQVSLLKMNAGIGQSIEEAASLERQNADLRADVSRLSSEERIAQVAERIGMVMPDAGEVRYVDVRGERDARKAAAVMRAPDPVEDTTATSDPAPAAATTTTTSQTTSTPTTSTPPATPPASAPAPTTTATPTAQPATQAPATGTTAGATAAPAGTTAAPGQ